MTIGLLARLLLVLLLVLSDLTDKTLEGQSADAKLGGLTKSDVVVSVPK